MSKKTFELSVGDKTYKVDVEAYDGKRARVKLDDKTYEIDVKTSEGGVRKRPPFPEAPRAVPPSPKPSKPEPPQVPIRTAPSGGEVLAPMPGLILAIMVSPGDQVTAGTPVVRMEAMKMENEIPATADGTVKTIAVQVGDNVSTDQTLMMIE